MNVILVIGQGLTQTARGYYFNHPSSLYDFNTVEKTLICKSSIHPFFETSKFCYHTVSNLILYNYSIRFVQDKTFIQLLNIWEVKILNLYLYQCDELYAYDINNCILFTCKVQEEIKVKRQKLGIVTNDTQGYGKD